jgi:hypothetical protein
MLSRIDWLFYVPLKNISPIWRRHHYRWRTAKFRPMLGAQGLWAGRDLYRPHLLWHGASVLPVSSEGMPVLTVAFYDTQGMWGIHSNRIKLTMQKRWKVVCLFIATRAIYQLSGDCHHWRWLGCKFRSMLGAQGLWAGRDLYCATPTATRDLGLYGLIRKTSIHVPQWDSNPPTEGSSYLCSNHCATRAANSERNVTVKEMLISAKTT